MLIIKYSNQFKKDYKKIKKRGLKIEELKRVIELLSNEKKLPEKNRDHALIGEYKRM